MTVINTRNAWQSPAVVRQARRTPHAQRMPAKTPLAGDKIDAPAACAVLFRSYCGGAVTRTRNVSKYMLVLALCLVAVFDLSVGLPVEACGPITHDFDLR